MLEDPKGSIDCDEHGAGPPLVLVPGSCSTGAAWRPVIAALGRNYRCVTMSLPGYGKSAERRTDDDPSIERVAEAVETVVRHTGTPVHLVGHSFGGLVATVVALRNEVPLASLTVLEAPAVKLLEGRPEDAEHYLAFRTMTEAYFAAFDANEREAIAGMIDFYGGKGTFAGWPARVRDYACETTAVNIRDWQSAFGFPLRSEQLAAVRVPSLVVWGARSHPAAQRANSLLAQALKSSHACSIADAAHFMIATHATEVAALIEAHVTTTHPL